MTFSLLSFPFFLLCSCIHITLSMLLYLVWLFPYHMHVYKYLFIHAWHVRLFTHGELLGPYTRVHGNIGSGG